MLIKTRTRTLNIKLSQRKSAYITTNQTPQRSRALEIHLETGQKLEEATHCSGGGPRGVKRRRTHLSTSVTLCPAFLPLYRNEVRVTSRKEVESRQPEMQSFKLVCLDPLVTIHYRRWIFTCAQVGQNDDLDANQVCIGRSNRRA